MAGKRPSKKAKPPALKPPSPRGLGKPQNATAEIAHMATEEEKEQKRRKRLDELELYEKTQEKLLVWIKRRFWWVIALGGLVVSSGGYAVVDNMLSGVTADATEAMIKAKLAADEIIKAKDAATEAVANAKKATSEAALAATQSAAATTQAAAASELAKQSGRDLAQALKKFKQESQRFASANEQLRKDLEAARSRFARDVEGLAANAAAIRRKADPNDESLRLLIDQLGESHSFSERTAAASALGQRGKDAKLALDDLKTACRNVRVDRFSPAEFELATTIARAIAQIDGESALPFLLEVMADPGATTYQQVVAGRGLAAVPVWSKQGVEMLRSSFDKLDSNVRIQIVDSLWKHKGVFAGEAVRATVLDLLIRGLEGDLAVPVAAYAIERHFAKDGEKSLPALRRALSRHPDFEVFRKAIEGAINAIEAKKQD